MEGAVSHGELDDALAALIANTRRVKRKLSLVEIADKLAIAVRGLGSLEAVAESIGLHTETLRLFESVARLCSDVKILIASRKLDSVDIAHRLTKLRASDQRVVARAMGAGDLTSKDVRGIVSLRKSLPGVPMKDVVERFKSTLNIKHYVVQFAVPPGVTSRKLRAMFERAVGKERILSLSREGQIGEVVLDAKGRRRLQALARSRRLTKRELVDTIVNAETG